MRFDEQFIKSTITDVSIIKNNFPEEAQFCIDSRVVKPGDIFIALSGVRCDGHEYISDAFLKGAAGCIIAQDKKAILDNLDKKLLQDKLIIAVPDTLKALISFARAWRQLFSYPVVGITGTVGKTSTKECLANILQTQGMRYIASNGNQNTLIGAALNLLRMREYHEAAIIEMGVARRGEMAELASLVRPTTALITNIGHQHMDGLGSLHDIALEKRDIFKYFSAESIGIINGDFPILANVSYPYPMIKFGSKMTNQIQARKVRVSGSQISFVLKLYNKKYSVIVKKPHVGDVMNSLAAAAAARLLNVPDATIVKAIQTPVIVAGRFEECAIKGGKGIIINDCYNANPESMKLSLLALQQIETKAQKIAVIGDMLGLGATSPFWHRQIGRFLRKVPSVRKVILVGSLVEWVKKAIPLGLVVDVELVPTWKEAADCLAPDLAHDPVVLVKGSRDLGLNNLVERFTNQST